LKTVVKIGGAALENVQTVQKCAQAIANLAHAGHRVAVVHGGGAAFTRVLKQMGRESEFVQGLRVTDAETRDVALMVLAGLINKKLVAALASAGCSAIGLCGGDGMMFRAEKKQMASVELGYVGEITAADSRWLEAVWNAGGIPVISSVALGFDGEYYNVNADTMAAACATACEADALIFLTDVPGVKNAQGIVIPWLNASELPALIADSVIAGGMLPKLEACTRALREGVKRVRILPAEQVEALLQFYSSNLNCGTEVMQ
jgi:acetylglutamate kinase